MIAVLSQARLRLESLDRGLGGGAEDTVPRPLLCDRAPEKYGRTDLRWHGRDSREVET